MILKSSLGISICLSLWVIHALAIICRLVVASWILLLIILWWLLSLGIILLCIVSLILLLVLLLVLWISLIVIRILIVRNEIRLKYPRFAYALKIQILVLWILVWGLSVLSSSTTLFVISSSTSDVLSARLFYFGLRLHGFEIKYQVLNKVACVWYVFFYVDRSKGLDL